MSHLTLASSTGRPLRPLVEAALQNELRLLEAGLKRSEHRLQDFETRHGMATNEFIQHYENDELSETLEFAEWIGEARLIERLKEKVQILRGVQFAD